MWSRRAQIFPERCGLLVVGSVRLGEDGGDPGPTAWVASLRAVRGSRVDRLILAVLERILTKMSTLSTRVGKINFLATERTRLLGELAAAKEALAVALEDDAADDAAVAAAQGAAELARSEAAAALAAVAPLQALAEEDAEEDAAIDSILDTVELPAEEPPIEEPAEEFPIEEPPAEEPIVEDPAEEVTEG
jgi:hypothetical protein